MRGPRPRTRHRPATSCVAGRLHDHRARNGAGTYSPPLPAAICRDMIVVSSYAVCEAATQVISAWS
ncbi:hypothetical protein Stsp01_09100 [Streptomyces sp. NBRC 13847]|nr:hypothetical protein Stsp01_09100 [Streptomyces sp. NBRC 13847]